MVTNKMTFGKAGSYLKGISIGTVVALALTMCYAILMSQLVLTDKIDVSALGYGSMILLPLASAVSAWIAVGIIKRKRMQVCIISGGTYFAMLGLINIFFFGGQFNGGLITAVLILVGVLCVGLLGMKGERGSRKKYRNFASR